MHCTKQRKTTRAWPKLALLIGCLSLSFYCQVFAAEQLYVNQPSVTPQLAFTGKYPVGVKTQTIVNPEQLLVNALPLRDDRALTLEIWYPAMLAKEDQDKMPRASYSDVTRAGGQFTLAGKAFRDAPADSNGDFPLVVLSHGYTGYRSIIFYLGEHLASHGYVVVSIDHTDSTNAEIDFEKAPSAGFLSTLVNRSRDQQFVLDYFSGAQNAFAELIDTQRSAVLGYSMGGYGALNTVGGCYRFNSEFLDSLGVAQAKQPGVQALLNTCNAGRSTPDPRWKALIAMAPWGGEQDVHTAKSLAGIQIPSLFVAGEIDDISGFENGVRKLYQRMGAAHKYLLVYENARHNIAAHPAPSIANNNDLAIGHYFEPAWEMQTVNRINQHFVLAFLNCHLQKQSEACGFLPTRQLATQLKQADGSLTAPWPGFKDRWAAGLQFHRASGVTGSGAVGACENEADETCLDDAD